MANNSSHQVHISSFVQWGKMNLCELDAGLKKPVLCRKDYKTIKNIALWTLKEK